MSKVKLKPLGLVDELNELKICETCVYSYYKKPEKQRGLKCVIFPHRSEKFLKNNPCNLWLIDRSKLLNHITKNGRF